MVVVASHGQRGPVRARSCGPRSAATDGRRVDLVAAQHEHRARAVVDRGPPPGTVDVELGLGQQVRHACRSASKPSPRSATKSTQSSPAAEWSWNGSVGGGRLRSRACRRTRRRPTREPPRLCRCAASVRGSKPAHRPACRGTGPAWSRRARGACGALRRRPVGHRRLAAQCRSRRRPTAAPRNSLPNGHAIAVHRVAAVGAERGELPSEVLEVDGDDAGGDHGPRRRTPGSHVAARGSGCRAWRCRTRRRSPGSSWTSL